MTTLRDAAQQALEALENSRVFVTTREKIKHPEGTEWYDERITALRAALAQEEPRNQCGETCERAKLCAVCARGLDEQEPVAWRHKGAGHFTVTPLVSKFPEWEPLYTTPPRREWQGLTEEDVAQNLRSRHDAAKLLEERRQEITQPRREWQGLTDDEISALFPLPLRSDYKPYSFARAIEAALKEKNQ
jgi:hypothetical protein